MPKRSIIIIGVIVLILIGAVVALMLLRGDEDTWLCQNGQWVKHGNPSAAMPASNCGTATPSPSQQSEIIINFPKANQTISSPLDVSGQARGSWYFEAVFPIKLVDGNGNVLGTAQAQAQSEWTTDNFVPFIAQLSYNLTATSTGFLVFNNDNSSGLPQNSKEFRVSVVINPSQATAIKVYFSNNQMDPQISCNKVFAATRIISKTQSVARTALEELLKGPIDSEKAQGFYTSINTGVKIQSLSIIDGVAKVDLDETLEQAVGGSCRVSAIRAEITQTLMQFSTVKSVVISINNRTEDILQP